MERQGFTEKDWKLFRSKAADWQEAFMDGLNGEYMELLSTDKSPSDKFWALEERIREDRKKAGVCLDMRRSRLIHNLICLMDEGAIDWKDLEGFSEELRGTVRAFTDREFLKSRG